MLFMAVSDSVFAQGYIELTNYGEGRYVFSQGEFFTERYREDGGTFYYVHTIVLTGDGPAGANKATIAFWDYNVNMGSGTYDISYDDVFYEYYSDVIEAEFIAGGNYREGPYEIYAEWGTFTISASGNYFELYMEVDEDGAYLTDMEDYDTFEFRYSGRLSFNRTMSTPGVNFKW